MNGEASGGPLVSVCLPNLNTRPFLSERWESIRAQTLRDWELVVFDNYSDDGAWEYLLECARGDSRVRIAQAPRTGMYENWNNCVRAARGRYVYIATSDDTMAPDCLEKMVDALESTPECAMAHCCLRVVDENGDELGDWWRKQSVFARSCGSLMEVRHIRRAPFDGLLHLLGRNVYISITQLLIRTQLFQSVGLFDGRWGSVGDFHWEMRASLRAGTIHVADTWAGWRVHSAQATAAAGLESKAHRAFIEEMIDDALEKCGFDLPPRILRDLRIHWRSRGRDLRRFIAGWEACSTTLQRRSVILKSFMIGSWAGRQALLRSLQRRQPLAGFAPEVIRSWLEGSGVETVKAVGSDARAAAKDSM